MLRQFLNCTWFGKAFNIGAKKIKILFILHINPDAFINNDIIKTIFNWL